MPREIKIDKKPRVIDVENTNALKQQTIKMLEEITFSYEAICDSMVLFEPISEILEQETDLRALHGEYFGYNNGVIDSSTGTVEVSIINMQKVIEGEYDDLTLPAMIVFVTMWYEIAKVEIESSMLCVENIVGIEKELFDDTKIGRLTLSDMQSTTIH